jgi:uncharacterized protein YjeT (DUF2065 family)
MHKTLPILGAALGLGLAANGLYMLVNPANWYFLVPGVTTTGPFNQHFLRDIGLIYLMTGAALVVGALRPRDRAVLWSAAAFWHAGHALFHFWEVSVGICGPSALARDFPAVTLPTLVMAALAAWSVRERAAGTQLS